ncbi:hypothetical protein CFAM422_003886 [Trichoderma lentiforme]|uniref:Uncharacterized protein n=1 Tax=Trichoderma lentiforme TaxID=1567552 RepID=A0A9P4XJ64_9HYPO|nr:hypothetical protein CFAM422_003886 [Trichoderma lentiforme]
MFGLNPDQRETEHRVPPLTDAIPNPKTRISENMRLSIVGFTAASTPSVSSCKAAPSSNIVLVP